MAWLSPATSFRMIGYPVALAVLVESGTPTHERIFLLGAVEVSDPKGLVWR
jgi:hypothetical protein